MNIRSEYAANKLLGHSVNHSLPKRPMPSKQAMADYQRKHGHTGKAIFLLG